MKMIKDFLIISLISNHGETIMLINMEIVIIISHNFKNKTHLDRMQLLDLKEKLILLIQGNVVVILQRTHLIHKIIRTKIKIIHSILNQVEGLLSNKYQIKTTSIHLMNQDMVKILINGETLGKVKDMVNKVNLEK